MLTASLLWMLLPKRQPMKMNIPRQTEKFATKLAIVVCYIGKLPWYFRYFVHSCRYNPSIDFFIITDDNDYPAQLPENVKVVLMSLTEINRIASDRLGFPVNVKEGYKMCDFKPTYGFLFSDLLKPYDFWGHGDLDVIFGNIRNFITDQVLKDHDLICVRHDFLTGYFLLYRNDDRMNTLFKMSRDYQFVLQMENHFCFDETNFQFSAFAEGKPFDEVPSEIESMMHVVKRMEKQKYIRPFFDFFVVEGVPGHLKWVKGDLFFRQKYEILLYHMIHFKKRYFPKKVPKFIPDTFTISTKKIYHKYH